MTEPEASETYHQPSLARRAASDGRKIYQNTKKYGARSAPRKYFQNTLLYVKVVVFLLGDEDKMLKVWKVRSLAECKVGTTSHSE